MFGGQVESAALIVTGGAVAFAVAVVLWAYRFTEGARQAQLKWRARAGKLEWELGRSKAIVDAHPGVVLVWEDGATPTIDVDLDAFHGAPDVIELDIVDEQLRHAPPSLSDWGNPLLFGSTPALAAMLRFADGSDGPVTAGRILDGLADRDGVNGRGETTTLRKQLAALRNEGVAFTLAIDLPEGARIDIDGRPKAGRVVLWIVDSTVKGVEASSIFGGVREGDAITDPVAFVDLLGKAPFPMFRLSSGLKLTWANPSYLSAVDAKNVQDAVQRDLQLDDRIKEQARSALAHGARMEEIRAVVTSGERRWYAISIFPISGGVAGVAIDVTREKEAKEALERHVSAQDDALNHLHDAVAIFGPNRELVFHNRAFRDLFDLDEGWLSHRPSHGEILDRLRERRLIPDQSDYQAWRAGELAAYARLDPDAEDHWDLPDGRRFRIARVRHPLGGLLLIFDDLTKLITLETEFNRLIKVQRATLDKLNEGVAVFASDGGLRLHNAAFETMWALPPGALAPGASFDDVVEQCLPLYSQRQEWTEMKARITDVTPENRRTATREIRRSDGTMLSYVQRPLPDGSTVIAFNDVTAARKLEVALKDRNEALEATDRLKSRFVENVSYHLRAPLTTVIGFAEVLSATVLGKLTESEASQLEAIVQASDDLNRLVEHIIKIGEIDAQTFQLDVADMDMRTTLEGTSDMVRALAEEKRARVSVACPRDVGIIRGDSERLAQAVSHLLSNALENGGRSIEVGAERVGGSVRIWVEDDGDGIPFEKQGHVFDAFTSGKSGGAGLGLTLVRAIIEMHGGWVEVESQPGVGTRVTCHLPAGGPKAKDAKPASTSAEAETAGGAAPPTREAALAAGLKDGGPSID